MAPGAGAMLKPKEIECFLKIVLRTIPSLCRGSAAIPVASRRDATKKAQPAQQLDLIRADLLDAKFRRICAIRIDECNAMPGTTKNHCSQRSAQSRSDDRDIDLTHAARRGSRRWRPRENTIWTIWPCLLCHGSGGRAVDKGGCHNPEGWS